MVSAKNLLSQKYRYCKLSINAPQLYFNAIYLLSREIKNAKDTQNISPLFYIYPASDQRKVAHDAAPKKAGLKL